VAVADRLSRRQKRPVRASSVCLRPLPQRRAADLILIMLDATKSEEQRRLLEIELDSVGIRLNKKRPDVVFKRKTTGGVRHAFSSGVWVIVLMRYGGA
jgi:hypothetical protein